MVRQDDPIPATARGISGKLVVTGLLLATLLFFAIMFGWVYLALSD
ncbi:MAG TPA: hypothetical protein VGM83_01350 [Devosiaceae bacterium]|jgi:hypothetical protein